ncbi:hypothetical protein [Acinetobacter radioresistens]|uniref:hypothetical protein n=1 Tax=Acinetobacter radioresistens TaxID=40216 RepID=UPI002A5A719E|nr:hypothetical protein [Acinetobacter radioresistens]MDY0841960.1 hypothetical protein [Acinetobacter radioresistens]
MLVNILESRLCYLIFAILLKIILDYSYVNYVVEVFAYDGFELNFDIKRYFLISLILIAISILTPKIINKISDYFFNIFLFLVIYPLGVMTSLNSYLSLEPFFVNIVVFSTLMLFMKLKFSNKKINVPYVKNGRHIYLYLSWFMIVYLIVLYVITGAISNFNLDLSKVYDFRDVNAELTNVGITAYLNSWVYQVFSIALMAYALLKKNYILFFVLILTQVFFFGIAAHKSILFSPLMVVGVYFYLSKTKALSTVPIMLFLVVLVGVMLFYLDNKSLLSSVLIRRIFFVPANLSFAFFDFFSNHQFNYWSDSILSSFQSKKYYNSIPQEVGNYLGTNARANNGLVSSGYAQAGYLGIFIYSTILFFILKLIDGLAEKNIPIWFYLVLVITPIRNLMLSSDLFTVLLTHGFIVAIIMLILFREKAVKKYG